MVIIGRWWEAHQGAFPHHIQHLVFLFGDGMMKRIIVFIFMGVLFSAVTCLGSLVTIEYVYQDKQVLMGTWMVSEYYDPSYEPKYNPYDHVKLFEPMIDTRRYYDTVIYDDATHILSWAHETLLNYSTTYTSMEVDHFVWTGGLFGYHVYSGTSNYQQDITLYIEQTTPVLTPIPEPATSCLLGLGGLLFRKRK